MKWTLGLQSVGRLAAEDTPTARPKAADEDAKPNYLPMYIILGAAVAFVGFRWYLQQATKGS